MSQINSMKGQMNNNKLHIALFPWPAFGHMIPFLNLAKLIAQKGHFVSFLSTTRNIERLPKVPPNLSSHITFIKLKFPHTSGLPKGAEATSDMTLEEIPYLKVSVDQLEPQISDFLKSSSPDWLFHDLFQYWVGPLASKLGIPTVFFSIFVATSLAHMGPPGFTKSIEDLTGKPRWIPFETNVVNQYFIAEKIWREHCDAKVEPSGVSDTYRRGMTVKSCDVVAVRSSYEVEYEWLKVCEDIYEKPLFPVGELPPMVEEEQERQLVPTKTNEFIMKWLDGKPSKSVVYVAFGSEATTTRDELTELALGLELSELSFLWVLKEAQAAELPPGFKQRMEEEEEEKQGGNKGLVYTSWAPQVEILSHDSVGGFLSHSGWTSVVEAIRFGKPLILFPLRGDLQLMARLLESKKLGCEVPRADKDGSFTRKVVADLVTTVVVGDEGRVVRETVKEMGKLFADRERQSRYIDRLLEYLSSNKNKTRMMEITDNA